MRSRRASEPVVAPSVDELLGGATDRTPLDQTDGKSGARLERVVIDGEAFVAKHLDLRSDWTMRAVGDLGCATLTLWRTGFLHSLPPSINQPIVGVASDPSHPGGLGTTLLMRDVGAWMVPEGDGVISHEQHRGFLEHLADLCAAFWGFVDDVGLIPAGNRYFELSLWTARAEAPRRHPPAVPQVLPRGWARLEEVAPATATVILPLVEDPSPLVAALAETPTTFVHGNWKLGNLGTDDAGRTVLIDWETPGTGSACGELAWYLAINCRRIPESKEATIDAFRAALERRGVDTAPWWDRQLGLALVGGLVHFGWEKALGDDREELGWWERRVLESAPLLA